MRGGGFGEFCEKGSWFTTVSDGEGWAGAALLADVMAVGSFVMGSVGLWESCVLELECLACSKDSTVLAGVSSLGFEKSGSAQVSGSPCERTFELTGLALSRDSTTKSFATKETVQRRNPCESNPRVSCCFGTLRARGLTETCYTTSVRSISFWTCFSETAYLWMSLDVVSRADATVQVAHASNLSLPSQ